MPKTILACSICDHQFVSWRAKKDAAACEALGTPEFAYQKGDCVFIKVRDDNGSYYGLVKRAMVVRRHSRHYARYSVAFTGALPPYQKKRVILVGSGRLTLRFHQKDAIKFVREGRKQNN